MKPFPIPLVALGPGSQPEDDGLSYLSLPQDMATFRPPVLPEPEALADQPQVQAVLHQLLGLLDQAARGVAGGQLSLRGLGAAELRLLNPLLGEGEASAVVQGDGPAGDELRVQESVFAGVWRLLRLRGGEVVDDRIEVGPIPVLLRQVAWEDGAAHHQPAPVPALPQVQNAPLLVDELRDAVARWQPGQAPHVVNLSLLPVTPDDIAHLDHQLGTGRVLMLSRGYGNCRITNTRLPHCWRVVYYNAMDSVILNTVEVVDMPEVALAAPEDLRDSHDRLADVLACLEAPA